MPIRIPRHDEVTRIPDLPERPRFRTPWRVESQDLIDAMHEKYGPDAAVIHAARLDDVGQIYYLYTNGDVRRF
jgi:hypothetical protein